MSDGIELSILQQLGQDSKIAPLAPESLPAFREAVDSYGQQLAATGVSWGAPPFALNEEKDPQQQAEALTDFFYKLEKYDGPKLSLLWQKTASFAKDRRDLHPLYEAGERVAADFDRGLGEREGNSFHTRQHAAEVLLCAHQLLLIDQQQEQPLSSESRLLLLFCALIHDWHHDGAEHNGSYFRLEKKALEAARPYLLGVTPTQLLSIDLMVRTSDLSGPHLYARQALAYQRIAARSETRPSTPPAPQGMEILASMFRPDQATACELAAMLRDADMMPLVGLTADYAALCSSRLSDEWARPLSHADYMEALANAMGRPRTPHDRPLLTAEPEDKVITFASRAASLFNTLLPEVLNGHARLMLEMGQEAVAEEGLIQEEPPVEEEASIDLSVFDEQKTSAENELPKPTTTFALEEVEKLRQLLKGSGYFDAPPFTLTVKGMDKLLGAKPASEMMQRISLAEQTADTLQRLHGVAGPLLSAVVCQLFETIGLRVDDAVYKAAAAIAREIDQGRGAGTLDDVPGGERNPYHNNFHILDMVLLCDILGQRATQRRAPASSPLARGLLILAALITHWHNTGRGNKVEGSYHYFYLQDRALMFAEPHLADMSKELKQSLSILVRSTDPREPYSFSRAAYAFHVGLGPRPDVPPVCESFTRLLGDPVLCTLVARLNDAVFVPFVGLGRAYSGRALVQLGREIGMPIDFNFARKSLIGPLLSRPPYQGEQPPAALLVGKNRVASFTSAEAQAIFNPALHALLLLEDKQK